MGPHGDEDEEKSLRDPLLLPDEQEEKLVQDGSLDFYGSPAVASKTGGSRLSTALALLVFMLCCSLSLYGVSYNLVLFMVSKLGLSNAAAATQVSIWNGVHDLSPLLVAYISDSHLGRFKATLASSLIYCFGLSFLSLSVLLVEKEVHATWLFFVALYVIALGKGFVAPLLAFGADQFDGKDSVEAARTSSYFNWYYFSSSMGLLLALVGVVYIEDRLGFSSALFVCTAAILCGITVFSSNAKFYRYASSLTGNPFARLLQRGSHKGDHSDLEGILLVWLGSMVYEAMRAQTFSLFVEQAALMDIKVGGFRVPPASLNSFDPISVLVWMVVYDRVLVPVMRRATGHSRGFTFFQRMGAGLVVMTGAMACAAVLEARRLANFHDERNQINVLWQIPQFALVGGSKVFYYVGLIEFLYDQAPENLRTLSAAMAFLSASVGSFLSGFLVGITSSITGEQGWIPRDLNNGHLDYFFWLLVTLGVANWLFFLASSRRYKFKEYIPESDFHDIVGRM
ncbi:protein NRT1/ PTR FAMILY 8.1-like [Selaginella moellendorffii]|uniref:protein NRT1/ PTR FAMILY 8.1-like n=1 Tax=Selaginella moellendorffii TaxID=88036 RepID=UPI000D1C9EB0|nr:protein NRT1/ PTR FAMILY 8.1-like [Selaginella moellendorffii]|eukprot:XP_024542083.1 protein NRT1/ PTR FAMILY 8.1-like [Selaginella moellendorffii]